MYSVLLYRTYDNDPFWYGVGYNDGEDAALWMQEWPAANAYSAVDWAAPGSQTTKTE